MAFCALADLPAPPFHYVFLTNMITPEQFAIIANHLNTLKEQQVKQSHMIAALSDALQTNFSQFGQNLTELIKQNPPTVMSQTDRERYGVAFANLVNIGQAAALTGRATSTLYSLASTGRLPAVKSGGRLRFNITDLEAFRNHPREVRQKEKDSSNKPD